jgi:hypothetical protein
VGPVKKQRTFHRAPVHDWIVDPASAVLTVLRWRADGYLVALTAGRGETVPTEPFGEIEIRVGELLGDDPEI